MSIYRLKGTSGPVVNQSFPLVDELKLGDGPECDIPTGADSQGAVIRLSNGSVHIAATGASESIFLNGQAVTQGELGSGDEIRIGQSRFILQAPGLKPDRVLAGQAIAPRKAAWPWLLAAALVSAAALAWYRGWLPW